ncbi:MAG: hypothetical protein K8S56_07625, partial [Candidatus Cloacimonetes bacterium]|nr:hypothetical protein [Candidatus Cloacimonadota bacterium]
EEETLEMPDEYALYFISDGILDTLSIEDPDAKNRFLLAQIGDFDMTLEKLIARFNLDNVSKPDDVTFCKIWKKA